MIFARIVFIILVLNLDIVALAQVKEMTRNEFADNLGDIKEGMVRREVERLLGKPSKVHVKDVTDYSTPAEIWYYGTNSVSDFPTLGHVCFDGSGNVACAIGSTGTSPNLDWIKEDALRDQLRLIHSMPVIDGYQWDPALVIKISNSLTELGKEHGLSVVQEYVKVAPLDAELKERVGLLLRVLHQVPEDPGYFPEWLLGNIGRVKPASNELLPRFPIHFVREIPVLMVDTYDYVMIIERDSTQETLEWYKNNGVWRDSKIELPSLSDGELEVIRFELMDLTRQYLGEYSAKGMTNMVCKQLERLKEKPRSDDQSKD
jgi:hypothetical protein